MPGEAKTAAGWQREVGGGGRAERQLTADLFSARSRSSTGMALKGFPISTVIFCRETSHQWVTETGRVPTAMAQPPQIARSQVLPLTCCMLPHGHSPSLRQSGQAQCHSNPAGPCSECPVLSKPQGSPPPPTLISFALLLLALVPGSPSLSVPLGPPAAASSSAPESGLSSAEWETRRTQ